MYMMLFFLVTFWISKMGDVLQCVIDRKVGQEKIPLTFKSPIFRSLVNTRIVILIPNRRVSTGRGRINIEIFGFESVFYVIDPNPTYIPDGY